MQKISKLWKTCLLEKNCYDYTQPTQSLPGIVVDQKEMGLVRGESGF